MLAAVAAWRARAAQRHALAELDARMLRDIGLGPAERRSEIAKPFWRG
ncbi:MAG: DUF1127 domain-containing protein [Alphaproteobacteria bacterium]|nr:DUF1127 domain-containing protein [Alphaproteobacteria bacterium]